MTVYAGRELLLKIAKEGAPTVFATIGVARVTVFEVNNDPAEAGVLGASAARRYVGEAGAQAARVSLQGVFGDSTGEGLLRAAALGAQARRYRMIFPNGDSYEADFIVETYKREGSYDGLEQFSAGLLRSGDGVWTAV